MNVMIEFSPSARKFSQHQCQCNHPLLPLYFLLQFSLGWYLKLDCLFVYQIVAPIGAPVAISGLFCNFNYNIMIMTMIYIVIIVPTMVMIIILIISMDDNFAGLSR